MKVTDLRRKLMAALVAGGSLAPGALYAADLNTNLVINGDFETVNLAVFETDYNGPRILNWSGMPGFAYSHDGSSSAGGVVPDYADGADPPGAGHWYFSPNLSSTIDAPGEFYQDINLLGGDTGATIASGTAGYSVSAWMSSFDTNNDFANVHLDFRNSGGASLGTGLISDSDPGANNVWNLNTGTGGIPIGTATVRLSVYGTPINGGPDGYTDNVDFRVTNILPALSLTVNRADGSMVLSNQTGAAENISGYSITSAFEGLAPASWLSIADNYDNGNPGVNQVDAAHAWTELTDPAAHTDLSEADLQAGTGASFANNRTIPLGNAGAWIRTATEDLVFQYISGGQVVDGIVNYVGNGNNPYEVGDLNTNGVVDSADWMIFRANQHVDLSGFSLAEAYRHGDLTGDKQNNHPDFVLFKMAFDNTNGAGSFAAMISGVPEPSSVLLVLAAGLFAMPALRRSTSRK